MKNINPLRTGRRIAKRIEKLGPNPSCVDCGESDIACLELDHPVGQERDPNFMQIVCCNCHRKREWKRDIAGLSRNGQHKKETPQESLYRYLMRLASLHEETAASLRRKAEELRRRED